MPPPNTPVDGTTTPRSRQLSNPSPPSSQSSQSLSQPTSTVVMDASQVKTAVIKMDYQAIDYVGQVDETLICPICRTAFYSPITTPCGHTFCAKCINRALERQRVCPIDRQPIEKNRDYRPIPLIIKEQLDRLEARCPNQGCDYVCARENLEAHYERHCEFTLVRCPKSDCDKLVPRHLRSIEGQCMHETTNCDFCLKPVAFVDLDAHWEKECEAAYATCPECDASVSVVNNTMLKHIQQECPEAMAKCKWETAGCKVADKRKIVREHERNGCVFETVGRLLEQQAEDRRIIQDLTRRLASLEASRDSKRRERRRISAAPANSGAVASTAATSGSTNPADNTQWESPHNYMLAQFERLESQMEELREMVCEMDMRQSASFLHHSKQVADRFLELGDKVGVLSMHTKWLLNMQYMQRNAQLRAANAASLAAAAGGGSTSGGLSGGSEGVYHRESSSGGGAMAGSSSSDSGRRRVSEGRGETLTRL